MTKIKVKINAPVPPMDTIHRYRDFDGLMANYQKYYRTEGIRDMLYNDRRKLVYIVIIVLLLLLLLFSEDIAQPIEAFHRSYPLEDDGKTGFKISFLSSFKHNPFFMLMKFF